MLSKIEVRSVQGLLLTLPFEDVSDGYVIEDVDGLTPVKATIVSSSFAQVDGTQFHSSRRESRNIKITLELDPDFAVTSVRALRMKLYNFFMPKALVDLRFYDDDGLTVDISGMVESCEPVLFSKEPKVDISIICFDPDFIDLVPVQFSGTTVETDDEVQVVYEGTVETGVTFTLNVDRSISGFTIFNRAPDAVTQSMDFTADLVAGDVLTVSTTPGSKAVTLTRAGSNSSLLYAKSPQSGWIELQNGTNNIRVFATGAGMSYTIDYTPRYGGL